MRKQKRREKLRKLQKRRQRRRQKRTQKRRSLSRARAALAYLYPMKMKTKLNKMEKKELMANRKKKMINLI